MWGNVCEGKRTTCRSQFLIVPSGSWRSNSWPQAWWQERQLAELIFFVGENVQAIVSQTYVRAALHWHCSLILHIVIMTYGAHKGRVALRSVSKWPHNIKALRWPSQRTLQYRVNQRHKVVLLGSILAHKKILMAVLHSLNQLGRMIQTHYTSPLTHCNFIILSSHLRVQLLPAGWNMCLSHTVMAKICVHWVPHFPSCFRTCRAA